MATPIKDSTEDFDRDDVLSSIYRESITACRMDPNSVKGVPSYLVPDAYNAKGQIVAKGNVENFEKIFPALLLKDQTALLEESPSTIVKEDSATRREQPPRQAKPKEGSLQDDWLSQYLNTNYPNKGPWRAMELFIEDTLFKTFPEAKIAAQPTDVPGIRPDFVVKLENETVVIDAKAHSRSYINKRSDVDKLLDDMYRYDASTGLLVLRDISRISEELRRYCENNRVVVLEANRSLGSNLRKLIGCDPFGTPAKALKPQKKDVKSGMKSKEGYERGDSEALGARRKDVNEKTINEKGDSASKALGPLKKDGTPDMRFKANRDQEGEKSEALEQLKDGTTDMAKKTGSERKNSIPDALGPLKKDGTPDMRFRLNHAIEDFNKQDIGSSKKDVAPAVNHEHQHIKPLKPTAVITKEELSSSKVDIGPLKKDGTPDMRYKTNQEQYSISSPSSTISSPGCYLKPAKQTTDTPEKTSPTAAGPLKKDGTPDMRYKANYDQYYVSSPAPSTICSPTYYSTPLKPTTVIPGPSPISSSYAAGPLKNDGTPDMRYKANYDQYYVSSPVPSTICSPTYYSTPLKQTTVIPEPSPISSYAAGPLKKDGTPDMRYKANYEQYSVSSPYPSAISDSGYYSTPSKQTAVVPQPSPISTSYAAGPLSSAGFSGSPKYSYNGNTSGPVTKSGLPDMRYSCNRRY